MNRTEKALQEIFVKICETFINNETAIVLFLDYYCQKMDYNSVLIGISEMGFKYYLLDNRLTIYCGMHKY